MKTKTPRTQSHGGQCGRSTKDTILQPYHYREFPSRRFCEESNMSEAFLEFYDDRIGGLLRFSRSLKAEKHRIATQIIHGLVCSGITGHCISDRRTTADRKIRQRVQVWDAIEAAGFVRHCKGSEESGKMTRYLATDKLLRMHNEWRPDLLYDVTLCRNTERGKHPVNNALVVFRSGRVNAKTGEPLEPKKQKQLLPVPKWIADMDICELESIIEGVNENNLRFAWRAYSIHPETGSKHVFQPNVCLKQIHSGGFLQAARLYTSGLLGGQGLKREVRKTILIGNEPAAELDFSGMATRMLYHFAKIDFEGDVYQCEQLFPQFFARKNVTQEERDAIRGFVKRATNICWNVSSKMKAHSAIARELRDHPERAFLYNLIHRVESASIPTLVKRLEKVHRPIRDRFFTEQGKLLMSHDGFIMLRILMELASLEIPALGIHDAVLCRLSDMRLVRRTMKQVYRDMYEFLPVIRRSF